MRSNKAMYLVEVRVCCENEKKGEWNQIALESISKEKILFHMDFLVFVSGRNDIHLERQQVLSLMFVHFVPAD